MSLKWPDPRPGNGRLSDIQILWMHHRIKVISLPAMLALSLVACSGVQPQATTPVALPKLVKLQGGDVDAMNYSPWYIHSFGIEGPSGTGIGGGGMNVDKIKPDGRPSTSGGACCTRLPVEWQPQLELTVRWLEFRIQGDKVVESWYKAENVRIPQYDGQQAGSTWVIFLPGDRVRVMVPDGVDPNGGNNPDIRPRDDDPYIAQGVIDDEWNEWYPGGVARGAKQ